MRAEAGKVAGFKFLTVNADKMIGVHGEIFRPLQILPAGGAALDIEQQAAAIADDTPISAWQPPAAAEMVAPFLKMLPISPATSKKRRRSPGLTLPSVKHR